MKKRWMANLLLFLIYPAYTHAAFFVYGGISGGANENAADVELSTIVTQSNAFAAGPTAAASSDNTSGIGQIQIGMGFYSPIYYLGIELIGQSFSDQFDEVHSNIEQSTFAPPTPDRYEVTNKLELALNPQELALDLKPGVFIFRKTLLYARVGIGANEIDLKHTSIVTNSTQNFTIDASSSKTEDVYPWRLGLGLERLFTQNLSIVMDYVYSHYGDISTQAEEHLLVSGTLYSLNSESEATDIARQAVTLGFNYYL